MFNDYANPVAASELPFQKPVIGNSGSAFCSVFFFVHEANATEAVAVHFAVKTGVL